MVGVGTGAMGRVKPKLRFIGRYSSIFAISQELGRPIRF